MYFATHCPWCGKIIADYENPMMTDENEAAVSHLMMQTKQHVVSYHQGDVGEKSDADLEWEIRKSMKMTQSKPPGT